MLSRLRAPVISTRRAFSSMPVPFRDKLFIDNEWVATEKTAPVENPATEETMFHVAKASKADVLAAVASSRRCFNGPNWGKQSTGKQRAEILRKMAAKLTEWKEDFSILESMDNGKPIVEARADIDVCIGCFDYYADFAENYDKEQTTHVKVNSDPDFNVRLVKEPAGVIGMITPWNFPLMQAAVKVAPALAAGCSMILKPSVVCPATCMRLGDLAIAAGLPPGALNIISGSGSESGAALLHANCDRLSFTGSSQIGHVVMHAAADQLIPAHMELGGKGAIVVFDDVDIEAAVDWTMIGIFLCAGQSCSATSRLIIHKDIGDKFLARLVEKANALRMGDPLDEKTQLGPLTSAQQMRDVSGYVERAIKDGNQVLCGGSRAEQFAKGYYFPATVIKCEPHTEAWKEEIFGPVLAVRSFGTEAEAVQLANDTPYGLGNAVISNDEDRCERVAQQLNAGVVWKNCSNAIPVEAPFGGFGKSGFGKEYGAMGYEEYLQTKVITGCKPGFSWGWYA